MHEATMNQMKKFAEKYLDTNTKLKILDVGSYNVNGSYKKLFDNPNWQYVGLDIEEGPNVDIVAPGLYDWGIEDESYDIVISGQCLEHVKDTKEWIKQIQKAVKKNGLICIIAPWSWQEHRFPVDCWRILPDGMRFLLEEVCEFEIIKVFKEGRDCIGIARKPE